MRLCVYEDARVELLEPLALTRPAFALRCGARTLLERQRDALAGGEVGAWVRPELAALTRLTHPGMPVNESSWLRENRVVLVNARWLPPDEVRLDPSEPHVGVIDDEPAYLVLPPGAVPPLPAVSDAWLAAWQAQLPARAVGGVLFETLWEFVDRNGATIDRDEAWFRALHGQRLPPPHVAVLGPLERFVWAADAQVEPFVLIDTRGGPVLLDRGAVVHSFSRLEGPCYVGPGSWVVGARLRAGTTLGPCCRIGGEVEASVVQGFTNKYHDGFLGHSYVGEWVNLAAGTQTSDLRNDYDTVRVTIAGRRIATGRTKVGSYLGDHTKSGLGALLNTGTVVGVFAGLLPSGELLPRVVPSFCTVSHGQLQEVGDVRKLLRTATTVMRRRGVEMTAAHRELYEALFERTAAARRIAVDSRS